MEFDNVPLRAALYLQLSFQGNRTAGVGADPWRAVCFGLGDRRLVHGEAKASIQFWDYLVHAANAAALQRTS